MFSSRANVETITLFISSITRYSGSSQCGHSPGCGASAAVGVLVAVPGFDNLYYHEQSTERRGGAGY